VDSDRIVSEIEVNDTSLGIDLATPCGLIITELVTNALRHAFPNDGTGVIRVILKSSDEHEYELEVSDNGVGAPENLDLDSVETLGLQMVRSLVQNQLEGTIELDRSAGTRFVIKFAGHERMGV
jgi:two-component sensor histidine kinase